MPIYSGTGRTQQDLSRTFDDLARRELAQREFAAMQRQRQIAAQQYQQDLALRQQQEARQAQTTQANLWMEAQAGNIANQQWAAGRQTEQAAEAENARRWNLQQQVAAEAAAELKKSQQYVRSRSALSEQLSRQDAQEAAAAKRAQEVEKEKKEQLGLRTKSVEENWQKVLQQAQKGLNVRDPDPARAQRIAVLKGTIQHVLRDAGQYEPDQLNQIKQDVYAEMLDLGLMEDLGFRQIEADGQTVTVGPTGRPVLPRPQQDLVTALMEDDAARSSGVSPPTAGGTQTPPPQGGQQPQAGPQPSAASGGVPPYGDFTEPPPERSFYVMLGEELKKKSEISGRFDAAGKRLLSKVQSLYRGLSDPSIPGQVREGAAQRVLEEDVQSIEWESYLGPQTAGTREKRGESVIEHQGDGRDLTTGFLSDRAKDTMWDSKITQKGGNYYQWSKEKQDWVPIGPVYDESQNAQAKFQMDQTKQQTDLQMKQQSGQLNLQTKAQANQLNLQTKARAAQLELQNKSRAAELELQRKTQEAVLEHVNKTQEREDGAARESQKAYFDNQSAELKLKMEAAKGEVPAKPSKAVVTKKAPPEVASRVEPIIQNWTHIPSLAKKVENPIDLPKTESELKEGSVYRTPNGRLWYRYRGFFFEVGESPTLAEDWPNMRDIPEFKGITGLGR